ncbi:MAG: hypothetical protein GY821_03435 [Gammaproteobacteria bacterium]|nr:hypothetical protein [Gammaproteobacteria bacterium]
MRIRFFLFSVLAMTISMASANTATRNAALIRVQVALSQLSPLIQTAEAAQDPHDPLQVNFQALRDSVKFFL